MKKKALFLVNLSTVYMCYSNVINEPYKFFYLKITGETKMTQNMNMNSEQTLTISQSGCCFAKTLWHFCGAHRCLERANS